MYVLRYIYIIKIIQKIEVRVERLTYLFRLCFTGYFQICFHLKHFGSSLTSIFWCFYYAFMLLKNPPFPHLIIFVRVLLPICSITQCCVFSYFYILFDPYNPLGSASPAVLVLYSLVISISACHNLR